MNRVGAAHECRVFRDRLAVRRTVRGRVPLMLALGLLSAFGVFVIAPSARAQEVPIGNSVSVTRTLHDWKAYFSSDMRELLSHAETTTTYDPKENESITVGEVDFDVAASSPIATQSVIHTVTRRGEPDFGSIRIESVSTTAKGETVETSYTLKQSTDAPIVVGPIEAVEIRPPPREVSVKGKTALVRAVSRTTEIQALLVAPTFEDLLAGRAIHAVREPGTHLETGSIRVLSPDGTQIGYFAGDVRLARGREYATPR